MSYIAFFIVDCRKNAGFVVRNPLSSLYSCRIVKRKMSQSTKEQKPLDIFCGCIAPLTLLGAPQSPCHFHVRCSVNIYKCTQHNLTLNAGAKFPKRNMPLQQQQQQQHHQQKLLIHLRIPCHAFLLVNIGRGVRLLEIINGEM